RREGSELWILYATAMVGFPLLVIVAARPQYMSPRYFLVGIALFQLLLAGFLARAWRVGPRGRAIVVVALVLVVSGNIRNLTEFWNTGRGGYGEAVRLIAERNPKASVGSNNDLTRLMIDYYADIEPGAAGVRYKSVEERPIGGWDWWVERRLSNTAVPPAEITDELGTRYLLERSYPHFWLSGVVWHLYARHEDESSGVHRLNGRQHSSAQAANTGLRAVLGEDRAQQSEASPTAWGRRTGSVSDGST
ncbi:MAG: hypothetical protein P8Y15_16445, partial [Gemmatimonadales bacterium]